MVAHALATSDSRSGEILARYGGDEFAILLPETDLAAASALGRRLCEGVREMTVPNAGSSGVGYVTISVGVACVTPLRGRSPMRPTMLVEAADHALYAAKAAGRNRVAELAIQAASWAGAIVSTTAPEAETVKSAAGAKM